MGCAKIVWTFKPHSFFGGIIGTYEHLNHTHFWPSYAHTNIKTVHIFCHCRFANIQMVHIIGCWSHIQAFKLHVFSSFIGHHQTAFKPVNVQTYDGQKCCLDRQLTRIWNSQWCAFVLSYVLTKVGRETHTHTHTSRSDSQCDSSKIFPVIMFVNCQEDVKLRIYLGTKKKIT